MMDLIVLFLIFGLYPILTIGITRLLLMIFPWRRQHPAQGTFAIAAVCSLIMLLCPIPFMVAGTLFEKVLWGVYTGTILGAMAAILISILCVSESGRRFYLLHMIESGVASLAELRSRYGHQHMVGLRLERLLKWGVVEERDGRYRMVRWSAYVYAKFFHLWGRLLGFHWK